MANQLKMADQQAIIALAGHGWSFRRIADELGVHRETVARYVKLSREGPEPDIPSPEPDVPSPEPDSKPAISMTGGETTKPAKVIAGSGGLAGTESAQVLAGLAGRQSRCEPFRAIIVECLERGLTAQRIWQDLQSEHGFAESYQSVQRFVRHLRSARPLPFRRMECEPGEEAQIDFGTGAPVITSDAQASTSIPGVRASASYATDATAPMPSSQASMPGDQASKRGAKGKRRRTHVFRIILSHSRKGYSESVFRQTTEEFIRCIENAFQYFGGIPKTLVIDNLKAAVTKADWYDPDLNPKIQAFCEHYGTVILPTRPRTPRHKGKVEKGVDYVQSNALKGRTFSSLQDQNEHLLEWESHVADTRIHGTTRKQVGKVFKEVERPTLQPLPTERFSFFHEAERRVHRDGHVAVDNAYYSVPPEYVGHSVWARWDSRVVRIFDQRMQQIAIHVKHEPGRFSTQSPHIVSEKISGVERGAAWLLNKAGGIGSHTQQWAESMVQNRGIQGVRVLQGLLSLANRHPDKDIEKACEIAQTHGAYRLRTIRELIKRQAPKQEQFEFVQEHPIIRSLADYGDLVHESFAAEPLHAHEHPHAAPGTTRSAGFPRPFPGASFPSMTVTGEHHE